MNKIKQTSNDSNYMNRLEFSKIKLYDNLAAKIQQSIRVGFDNSLTQHEAQAHIDVAYKLGLVSMALDMEVSLALNMELDKAAFDGTK